MKTGRRVFAYAAGFGIVLATIYGLTTREPAGVLLLGFFGFGLAFATGYLYFAERKSKLGSDDPEMRMSDVVGERIGVVTTETPWPPVFALGGGRAFGRRLSSRAAHHGLRIHRDRVFRIHHRKQPLTRSVGSLPRGLLTNTAGTT